MFCPAITRFRLATLLAILLNIAALILALPALGWAVDGTFLVAMGLGVALPQLSFFGPFVCRGSRSRRWVALTFDDGPDIESTPLLLDLLREAGIQAAFFCIGKRLEAHPEVAARIVREGHLLENHSYSHSNATNFFTIAQLKKELDQTQRIAEQAAGVAPRYFRPPMGLSNPRIFKAARSLGLTVIGWSARGLDTLSTKPEWIVRRIVRRLEPGAIILLHDGGIPSEQLLATVKSLLDTASKGGYEVVRLDRILK